MGVRKNSQEPGRCCLPMSTHARRSISASLSHLKSTPRHRGGQPRRGKGKALARRSGSARNVPSCLSAPLENTSILLRVKRAPRRTQRALSAVKTHQTPAVNTREEMKSLRRRKRRRRRRRRGGGDTDPIAKTVLRRPRPSCQNLQQQMHPLQNGHARPTETPDTRALRTKVLVLNAPVGPNTREGRPPHSERAQPQHDNIIFATQTASQ